MPLAIAAALRLSNSSNALCITRLGAPWRRGNPDGPSHVLLNSFL